MKKSLLKIISLVLILATLCLFACSCSADDILGMIDEILASIGGEDTEPPGENYEIPEGSAELHYINVGQGDSTLIMAEGKAILIDTGERDGDNVLINYLNSLGITELEYFIITHFDSDHFGEAQEVLESFTVNNLIIPDQVKTTRMYENFMIAVEERPEINVAVVSDNDDIGDMITVDSCIDINGIINVGELEIKILAPVRDSYSGSNDYSIIMMVRWGNNKFLITGDAEEDAEEAALDYHQSSAFACDVYKAGHHGSSTSSSQELLDCTGADYVIVSCGLDNEYGHPHIEAMERFDAMGAAVYRTDLQGTIVAVTDGENITFTTEIE